MNSKAIIIFPYGGYENNEKCEWYFWWTVDRCKEIDPRPVVVLTRENVIKNEATSFLEDDRYDSLEVIQTWSVDSCQTWLTGWGHVLDHYPEVDRIVQIPGDIDFVHEDISFYDNLKEFIKTTSSDIAIGDFTPGDKNSAKSLVDTYGTYSLLANWFPEISKGILTLSLNRPRSEFLNIKTSVLRELILKNRNFAYEQTLNFLIKSWDYLQNTWKYNISVFPLGSLADVTSFRNYRGCINQIERTERMLSLLWREINEPKKKPGKIEHDKQFEERYIRFSDKYEKLIDRSKNISETARITIRALLGV
jgi:hypothetical protein